MGMGAEDRVAEAVRDAERLPHLVRRLAADVSRFLGYGQGDALVEGAGKEGDLAGVGLENKKYKNV